MVLGPWWADTSSQLLYTWYLLTYLRCHTLALGRHQNSWGKHSVLLKPEHFWTISSFILPLWFSKMLCQGSTKLIILRYITNTEQFAKRISKCPGIWCKKECYIGCHFSFWLVYENVYCSNGTLETSNIIVISYHVAKYCLNLLIGYTFVRSGRKGRLNFMWLLTPLLMKQSVVNM